MSIPASGPGLSLIKSPTLRRVPVSEAFGPVWQGEGPHAGRLCHFLRLGLCNLHCSWCDTPYTWDDSRYDVKDECPERDAQWISHQLQGADMVVLSGGEPLMHQGNQALQDGVAVVPELHVETNGTIVPNRWALDQVDHFTVSPKVAYQGDPEKLRLKQRALDAFVALADNHRAVFKVVCQVPEDVRLAFNFYERLGVPEHARWVMPEGTEPDELLSVTRRIAPSAISYGLNLTLRQHTLIYGSERKR